MSIFELCESVESFLPWWGTLIPVAIVCACVYVAIVWIRED